MSTQELECGESSGALVPDAAPKAALVRARQKIWTCIAAHIYHRALRRAESELMMLDDRTLRDIGVTRAEIPAAVRRANATLLTPIVP